MGSLLTSIIGVVARGSASKAIASAIPGLIAGSFIGPQVLDAFQSGVAEGGAVPAAHALGMALGGVMLAAVNYAVTWLAPANKPS